jgi:hypothetical protein
MSCNFISESFRLAELAGVPGRSEFHGTPRHFHTGTAHQSAYQLVGEAIIFTILVNNSFNISLILLGYSSYPSFETAETVKFVANGVS